MLLKAVLYARVSSDRQEKEGFSIPAQKKLLKEYAKTNNINIVEEFVEPETAKKAGRTKFNEMLKYLRKHPQVRIILVEKTDRIYRNLKDYVTLDEFKDLEVHLVKEHEIISDKSSSHEKFVHGLKVLMAKNYIDNLSEEIRKGLQEKCAQGYYPSSLPIGYENKANATGKKEIFLSSDAPFIKQIFEKYLLGDYTYKSLAQEMSDAGFFPKNRPCINKTVEHILHNEFYTGIFYFKGVKYYDAKHPAIITPDLFVKVQEKMKSKYKIAPKKHKFAYSGFIKCAHCGKSLIAELQHGKHNSGDYVYYRCHHCKGITIREDRFEDAFYNDVLKKIEFPEEFHQEIIRVAKELVECETVFAETSMNELHHKIQVLKRRLSQLYTDRCDGMVDDETYLNKRNEWQMELDKNLVKYEKINNASDGFVESVDNLSNLCKNAPQHYLRQSQEQKRKMMNLIMSNPVFDGSNLFMPVVPAFEYAMKLKNVETVGVEPTSKMDQNKSLRV